jgi:hypothetical protein
VGDVPGVSVKVKENRAVFFGGEKPPVKSFTILRAEERFVVWKAKRFRLEIKVGLGKENEEILYPWIEEVKGRDQDHDQSSQVSPVDRHEQHLPERFVSSHALLSPIRLRLQSQKGIGFQAWAGW